MPPNAEVTKRKLLDAATRLFAQRGIYGVSLAEITKAAGQRNASALHYHFKSRHGILEAILRRHIPAIRERRLELLAHATTTPSDDVRAVVEALVRPVTELAQRGWRERAYLHIGAELVTGPERTSPDIRALMLETAGWEVRDLLVKRSPPLPADIQGERFAVLALFIGRAASDRARLLESRGSSDERFLSEEEFVSNLIDMVVGAVTIGATPVLQATPAAVSHAPKGGIT
jgi:AcrR family transcriptional regulator